jgi:hypothetical protein
MHRVLGHILPALVPFLSAFEDKPELGAILEDANLEL